jgi:hypothetical protein
MNDAAFGFLLLGIALLVVLGIAFVIASRGGRRRETLPPPPGVHMPGPSFLPVVFSFGAVLLGMGFALKGDAAVANPFLAIPGVLVIISAVVGWVRAANHEWVQVERGGHDDDGSAH